MSNTSLLSASAGGGWTVDGGTTDPDSCRKYDRLVTVSLKPTSHGKV